MNETHKIQEFANKQLEAEQTAKPFLEPEMDGVWRRLTERKWEYRQDGIVLATIFHKPNNKFSLFVPSPNFYKKVHQLVADTFLFDTFDEAVLGLRKSLNDAKPWISAVNMFLEQKI